MVRHRWVEVVRCPNCRTTGEAQLSAEDEYCWIVRVDIIPQGFRIIQAEIAPIFYCFACDVPAEP
jgi:hypothetical protein